MTNFCDWSKPTGLEPLGEEWRARFAPATHFTCEWTDIWLDVPYATHLRVSNHIVSPFREGLFRVRFENQIGTARLQSFNGDKMLGELCIEVLSRKFPTPHQHLVFFRALLDDLCEYSMALPFALRSSSQSSTQPSTQRNVAPLNDQTSPFWTLQFVRNYSHKFFKAWNSIERSPHRDLHLINEQVALSQANDVDNDTLQRIVTASNEWQPSRDFILSRKLGGFAPPRVWQSRFHETHDTTPNRFVLHFLRQLQTATHQLLNQKWWPTLDDDYQYQVRDFNRYLHHIMSHSQWRDVGAWNGKTHRVLEQHRDYRALLELHTLFHSARAPLWNHASKSLNVRDIAQLYETWTWLALICRIAQELQIRPQLDVKIYEHKIHNRSAAFFEGHGTLIYQQSTPSYVSVLRPDFLWRIGDEDIAIFDAKFRLERIDWKGASPDRDTLYQMHAYRDALGVRCAVSVYPGTKSVFYDAQTKSQSDVDLPAILKGHAHGIGALALSPNASLV